MHEACCICAQLKMMYAPCQVAFLACATGLLFFRTRLHPTNLFYGNLYFGALFYSIIHMMVNGLSELTLTVQRMGVFFKQASSPGRSSCISQAQSGSAIVGLKATVYPS